MRATTGTPTLTRWQALRVRPEPITAEEPQLGPHVLVLVVGRCRLGDVDPTDVRELLTESVHHTTPYPYLVHQDLLGPEIVGQLVVERLDLACRLHGVF